MTPNRPDLMTLLGHYVTVTNPHVGSSWSGKLVALADDPFLVIDQHDGTRMVLPQRFYVAPASLDFVVILHCDQPMAILGDELASDSAAVTNRYECSKCGLPFTVSVGEPS